MAMGAIGVRGRGGGRVSVTARMVFALALSLWLRGSDGLRSSGGFQGNLLGEGVRRMDASESQKIDYVVWVRVYHLPYTRGKAVHTETWLCPAVGGSCISIGFGDGGAFAFGDMHDSIEHSHFFGNETSTPKQRHNMGVRTLSWADVTTILQQMRMCGNWGKEYRLLTHNCNSFTMALLFALGFKQSEFPRALRKRPERLLLGNSRYLGYWDIFKKHCSGNKCLHYSEGKCKDSCEWQEVPGGNAECIASTGVVKVFAEDFPLQACAWTMQQLPFKKAAQNLHASPEVQECWIFESVEDRVACCAKEDYLQEDCQDLVCLEDPTHIAELRLCCEEHSGLQQCLTTNTLSSDCGRSYAMLGNRAGLLPRSWR